MPLVGLRSSGPAQTTFIRMKYEIRARKKPFKFKQSELDVHTYAQNILHLASVATANAFREHIHNDFYA